MSTSTRYLLQVTDDDSYDPAHGEWDFGRISALREIALALEGGYEYYYMGTSNSFRHKVDR